MRISSEERIFKWLKSMAFKVNHITYYPTIIKGSEAELQRF
jgi:hypothetical protein